MNETKQPLMQVYLANRAYAEVVIQHPEVANEIELAWNEYLELAGWDPQDWAVSIRQALLDAQTQEELASKGLTPEQIKRSLDDAS
jgi:hypothetical protein